MSFPYNCVASGKSHGPLFEAGVKECPRCGVELVAAPIADPIEDDDFQILGSQLTLGSEKKISSSRLGTGNIPLRPGKSKEGLAGERWQSNRKAIEQERRSYGKLELERKKKIERGGQYELGNRSPSPTKKQIPAVSETIKFYIWVCFKNSRFWTGHGNVGYTFPDDKLHFDSLNTFVTRYCFEQCREWQNYIKSSFCDDEDSNFDVWLSSGWNAKDGFLELPYSITSDSFYLHEICSQLKAPNREINVMVEWKVSMPEWEAEPEDSGSEGAGSGGEVAKVMRNRGGQRMRGTRQSGQHKRQKSHAKAKASTAAQTSLQSRSSTVSDSKASLTRKRSHTLIKDEPKVKPESNKINTPTGTTKTSPSTPTQSPPTKRLTRRTSSGENLRSLSNAMSHMPSPSQETKLLVKEDSEESTDVDVSGMPGWKGWALRGPRTKK